MTPKEFKKMRVAKRLQCVKEHGEYIAGRFFGSFNVYLYQVDDFYVELWKRIGHDEICYVELLERQETLDDYMDNINLKKDLGLE